MTYYLAHRSQGRPRTDQRACFIPLLKRAGATFHALDFSELLLLQQESTFVHYLRTVKYPDWPGWNYIRRRLLKHAKNHSRLERQEKLVCFVMPISWKIWLPSSKLTYGVATSCFFFFRRTSSSRSLRKQKAMAGGERSPDLSYKPKHIPRI